MKKFEKVIFGILFGVFAFIFTACEMFTSAVTLRDEIEKAVDKEQAAYCKVSIRANMSEISKIGPGIGVYDSAYKPTDSVNLSFEPSKAY